MILPTRPLCLALLFVASTASANPRLSPGEEHPAPSFSMETVRGAVLDLCALEEESDGTQSVKQRGILLGPAGMELFDTDPKLASIGASFHARETFISRFPLDRLYGVVSSLPGRTEWLNRESIPLADLQTAMSNAATGQAFAGMEPGSVERERAFVRSSLPCTDWVFVPVVDRVDVRWRWQPVEMRTVGAQASSQQASAGASIERREMYLPDVRVLVRIGVFQRMGDTFEKVSVVSGGDDKNRGMPDIPPEEGYVIPPHISAIPDAAGSTEGTASAAMLSRSRNEQSDRVCKARTMWNPDVWSLCTVRVSMEMATGGAQKSVRELPGLLLFAELRKGNAKDAVGPGIAIGRHEGVKVGYGFYTKSEDGKMRSYFKVTKVGPGGLGGDGKRTVLRNRFGSAAFGERVFEYPQSNLYMGLRFGGGPLLGMSGPTTFTQGAMAGQTVSFPEWTAGASLSFMWDYSALSRIPESRTGAEIHFLTGLSESISLLAIPVDFPNLEQGIYVGPRTKLFASIAMSGGWLFVGFNGQAQANGLGASVSGEMVSGYLIGGAASVGVEYMQTPDRLLRFDIAGRTYSTGGLKTDADTFEFEDRDDRYASLMARLSYEFAL